MKNRPVLLPLIIFSNLKSVFFTKENKAIGIIALPISIVVIPLFIVGAIVVGTLALVFQFFIDIFF